MSAASSTPSTWRVQTQRTGQPLIQHQRCCSFGSRGAATLSITGVCVRRAQLFAMVAMVATIMKPPAPVGWLPIRGNCKQSGGSWSQRGQLRFVVRAESEESVVGQTPTSLPASGTDEATKPSPLQNGGGDAATTTATTESKFDDPRWRAGTWDITKFTRNGKVDWDAVIDAEVVRRKWLEENPEASDNSEPVVFDTGTVPWWAWVKRFHLPEAELINGRAAMVGYGVGYLVDSVTGAGLVDQQSSFLGKLLLLITVLGVMLIRKNSDVKNLRTIAKESTFYDKQWQATWKDGDSDDKDTPSNP